MSDNPYDLAPEVLQALDRYAHDAKGQPARPELVRRIVRWARGEVHRIKARFSRRVRREQRRKLTSAWQD